MRDKTGRPTLKITDDSKSYDLEGRKIFIPLYYIKSSMVDPTVTSKNDGTENGVYGGGKYGRCRYGPAGPVGIYGYDTYGNSTYE